MRLQNRIAQEEKRVLEGDLCDQFMVLLILSDSEVKNQVGNSNN